MECNLVRQHLDRYSRRELTPELEAAVEEHLGECEACRQELMEMQNLCMALNDPVLREMVLYDPAPLPADFTDRVMERIEAERRSGINLVWPWLRQRWSRRQYASAAYAMSATMVLVSASNMLFLWNETTDRFGILMAQLQAYWEAGMAYLSGVAVHLASVWESLINLF